MEILHELKEGGLSAFNSREEIVYFHTDAEYFKERYPKRVADYEWLKKNVNNTIHFIFQYDPPSAWGSSDFYQKTKDTSPRKPEPEKEFTIRVTVTEVVTKPVTVHAKSRDSAINKIADMYGDDFIELAE